MKNLCLLAFLFISVFSQAQIITFPDNNFKFNLISGNNVDTNGDGNYDGDVDTNNDNQIQVSEAEAVVRLLINFDFTFPIESLEGIEYFANLEIFKSDNNIINADFSQNMSLISIDMFANENEVMILPPSSNLLEVIAHGNHITSIDVSQNPNLEILNIGGTQITNLDLSQNPNLLELIASDSLLTNLDVTHNTALKELFLSLGSLTSLDVTQNPHLQRLVFNNNSISEIDVSQNPDLRVFSARYNPIQNLDLTQNPLVSTIEVRNTQLSYLNIRNENNTFINNLLTRYNPALDCILVDDVGYANAQTCSKTGLGWCRDNETIYSETCTIGIQDFNQMPITLFPNPVRDIFTVSSQESIDLIQIYSIDGRLVKEDSNASINISELPTGLYFTQIYAGKISVIKKLIKL